VSFRLLFLLRAFFAVGQFASRALAFLLAASQQRATGNQTDRAPSVTACRRCRRLASPAAKSHTASNLRRPCHCEDPPAPPARRGSRGSLGISPPPKMAGSSSNREQLLPPSGGGAKGVPVKVDGHQATATLSSSGLR